MADFTYNFTEAASDESLEAYFDREIGAGTYQLEGAGQVIAADDEVTVQSEAAGEVMYFKLPYTAAGDWRVEVDFVVNDNVWNAQVAVGGVASDDSYEFYIIPQVSGSGITLKYYDGVSEDSGVTDSTAYTNGTEITALYEFNATTQEITLSTSNDGYTQTYSGTPNSTATVDQILFRTFRGASTSGDIGIREIRFIDLEPASSSGVVLTRYNDIQ